MNKRSYPFHSPPVSPRLSSREVQQQQLPKGPLQKKMSMAPPSITATSQNSLSTWRMPVAITSSSNRHSLQPQTASTAATPTVAESAKKQSNPPSGRKNRKNLQLVVPPVRSSISAPSSPQLPPQNPPSHTHTHSRRPSTPICVYQKNKTSENGAADPMALMSRTENAIGEELPYKDEPICILPNLYLGSELNAANRPMLDRLGIKFILNVAMEVENPYLEDITRMGSADPLHSPGSESSFRTATSSPIGPTIQVDSPLSSRANSLRRSSPSNSRPTSLSLTGAQAAMMNGITLTVPATSQFDALKYRKFFWTHNQENLPTDFILAFAFIDEARSAGKNILVHCQCGVSRSASLVIAYVMKANRMTLNQAYEFVKDRSPYISPNMSLVYQLVDFEKTLKLGNTNNPSTGRQGRNDSVRTHSRSSSIESDLLLKGHRRSNSITKTNSLDSPPRTPPAITTESMTLGALALHQSTVKGGTGRFHVITATSPVSPSSPSTLSTTSLSPTSSTTSPTTPSTSPSRRSSRPPVLSTKTSKSSLGSSRPRSPCRPIDEIPQEQQPQSTVNPMSPSYSNRVSTSSELSPSSYHFADFDHDPTAFALSGSHNSGVTEHSAVATAAMTTACDGSGALDKDTMAGVFSPTRASPPASMTSFADLWSGDENRSH